MMIREEEETKRWRNATWRRGLEKRKKRKGCWPLMKRLINFSGPLVEARGHAHAGPGNERDARAYADIPLVYTWPVGYAERRTVSQRSSSASYHAPLSTPFPHPARSSVPFHFVYLSLLAFHRDYCCPPWLQLSRTIVSRSNGRCYAHDRPHAGSALLRDPR